MKLGNSVWVTKDAKISDEFKSTGKSYYDAEANEVDFSKKQTADIINKWIDNQTAGKIKKIVDSFDKNTFMALINTVYFKAKWANQFMPQNTTKQKFTLSDGTTQDVDMMKKTMSAEYYKGNKFEAVMLPYEDADFRMYIFLPDKGNTVDALVNQMTLGNWNTWINQFDNGQVTVSIPKFKIEFEQELNGMLKSFGMKTAFTDRADFSKITDNASLYIDLVKQKCYIDVNESGTEAAAVTGLVLEGTSMIIGKPIEFTADRSFIYAISDKKTGLIMFMGVVEKP
jgi:serpin B